MTEVAAHNRAHFQTQRVKIHIWQKYREDWGLIRGSNHENWSAFLWLAAIKDDHSILIINRFVSNLERRYIKWCTIRQTSLDQSAWEFSVQIFWSILISDYWLLIKYWLQLNCAHRIEHHLMYLHSKFYTNRLIFCVEWSPFCSANQRKADQYSSIFMIIAPFQTSILSILLSYMYFDTLSLKMSSVLKWDFPVPIFQ